MTAAGATAVAVGVAVAVEDLAKAYGGRPILRGLSFEINSGETFALLGPNGAGKTTTVEILEGYRRADGGRVSVLGSDPARAGRDHRARVGLMLQGGGGVDPRMSVREAVDLHGRFHRQRRATGELLRLVGLEDMARIRARRLSGGERQRLGLALALVGGPELVILDEPTAGMDVEARAAVRGLLGTLRADGVTILLTSHDLTDIERVADRIAIIDRGRLVAIGSPTELSAASASVIRFRLERRLDGRGIADLEARLGPLDPGASVVDEEGGRYRLDRLEATPGAVAALSAWAAERGVLIGELRAGGATLEERYLEIIRAAGDEAVAE
ncbi:MAG TPA: ABC transporter ATP-binding protein [Candidatus Limnocylindrales bacterium]|nr:ABC transporter ATP-binding protein [Candidatus Limnocylindrales bacterium]